MDCQRMGLLVGAVPNQATAAAGVAPTLPAVLLVIPSPASAEEAVPVVVVVVVLILGAAMLPSPQG
jgi:hypothetical protein